jgi:hypothetical protein
LKGLFPGHEEFESHDFEVGVSDWGVVSPDEHTISRING